MWTVTGANGFIGSGFCQYLGERKVPYVALTRREMPALPAGGKTVVVPQYEYSALASALEGSEIVVHLAGGAHGRNWRTSETGLALKVTKAAADAGIRHIIYVSSIKAQSGASADHLLTEELPPKPNDDYGRGKLEAEQSVIDAAGSLNLTWTVVRPTLVYGPGVKGHLTTLMSWLYKGVPLPLRAVHNRRSMVSLQALCDLLFACGNRVEAAGEHFIAADPEPVSTAQLVSALKKGLQSSAAVWPIPPLILKTMLTVIARRDWGERLLGSLEASPAKAYRLLGWRGEKNPEAALAAMARDWLAVRMGRTG